MKFELVERGADTCRWGPLGPIDFGFKKPFTLMRKPLTALEEKKREKKRILGIWKENYLFSPVSLILELFASFCS